MLETIRVTVIGAEACSNRVAQFRFSRPATHEFKPGQWLRVTLPTTDGEQTKTFSYSSAPLDPWIEMATRLSDSAFKQALQQLVPGDEVAIAGPGGVFGVADDARKVAFLAGGVGITPVRSILRDAAQRGREFDDAAVFYGNRDATCVLYRDELGSFESHGVRVVDVLEQPDPAWRGERGFVSASLIERNLDAIAGYTFVVAGPPPMVAAMVRVLDELDVAEKARVVESFGRPLLAPADPEGEH